MKKLAAALLLAATTTGCAGEDLPPLISPLNDQHATVGVELTLTVRGTDPEGGDIEYSFAADDSALDDWASLRDNGDGATFRWTPTAADIGVHTFEFTVSDGENTASETVAISVEMNDKGGTAPLFVQPLGTGTTLDLRERNCLDLPVAVEDSDSTGIDIDLGAPLVEGVRIEQFDDTGAMVSWCPSQAQIEATDRYTITLTADDYDNPQVAKDYLVVLQGGLDTTCEGSAPLVEHAPRDVITGDSFLLQAHVSDDRGLRGEPLLYFSETDPGVDPDLSSLTQLTMSMDDGDMRDGLWSVQVPNPVAGQGEGASAMLYYVIVAQDADAEGCSHWGQSPEQGAYRMQVTHPDDVDPPPPMCVDDSLEEDDTAATARQVDLDSGPYNANNNAICSLDDDWYSLVMYAGETIHATLEFSQLAADQDIDILVYKDGVNLTGCNEQDPSLCDGSNGQSASPNERLAWPITTSGTYEIVIRGWDGATNPDYDICIGLTSAACP